MEFQEATRLISALTGEFQKTKLAPASLPASYGDPPVVKNDYGYTSSRR